MHFVPLHELMMMLPMLVMLLMLLHSSFWALM
jgi:hypothetical protein